MEGLSEYPRKAFKIEETRNPKDDAIGPESLSKLVTEQGQEPRT